MPDLLIKSGTVVDGTGAPGFLGSLLVDGGRIIDVVRQGEDLPSAKTTLDAEGLVIAPGFIDMHSHSDWVLPAQGHPQVMRGFVEQGVTTIVSGNCGASPAPVSMEKIRLLERLASMCMAEPFDYEWESMAGFLDHVDVIRPVVNMAELVGHASIRFSTSDTIRGTMTGSDLDSCLKKTRQALDEGACGLSFGLGYDPGMYSSPSEIEAFCNVAARADKPVVVHLRAYSRLSPCYPPYYVKAHNIRALKEMFAIAQRAGARLQLSHFTLVGKRTWSLAGKCLGLVEKARGRGLDIMVDAFPYTCGNTSIVALFRPWFLAGLPGSFRNPRARARLKLEVELGLRLVGFSFENLQLMDVGVAGWEDLNGMRITEIAEQWGISPFRAWLKLAEKSNGAALVLYYAFSGEPGREEAMDQVLSHESCLFETDAVVKKTGHPNPASMGTFPRILGHYVREKKSFSLENAVNRMTLASARRFGLKDVGGIKKGMAADLVVFNAETISDTPPRGREPAARPRGIKHVFINGTHVVEEVKYIDGARAGRVLRT